MERKLLIRALICLGIGVVAGFLCFQYQTLFQRAAGDLTIPQCAARALIAGNDPYDCPRLMSDGSPGPSNPLTTALVVLPLAFLPSELLAGVFFGLLSVLMAWALTQEYTWWRLIAFISCPFFYSLQVVQWSPLIVAIALLPILYPLSMVKPQMGLPVAIMHFSIRRALICIGILIITLLIDWDWPLRWMTQISSYDGFIPILTIFGFVMLYLLRYWRNREAQWLLLYAIMPQRVFYDQLILWILPRNMREMMILTVLSWIGFFAYMFTGIGVAWVILSMYLPSMFLVLYHLRLDRSKALEASEQGVS